MCFMNQSIRKSGSNKLRIIRNRYKILGRPLPDEGVGLPWAEREERQELSRVSQTEHVISIYLCEKKHNESVRC